MPDMTSDGKQNVGKRISLRHFHPFHQFSPDMSHFDKKWSYCTMKMDKYRSKMVKVQLKWRSEIRHSVKISAKKLFCTYSGDIFSCLLWLFSFLWVLCSKSSETVAFLLFSNFFFPGCLFIFILFFTHKTFNEL